MDSKTQIQKRDYLESIGLDFLPVFDNDLWYVQVWKDNKPYKTGKKGYESSNVARIETEKLFYKKFNKK